MQLLIYLIHLIDYLCVLYLKKRVHEHEQEQEQEQENICKIDCINISWYSQNKLRKHTSSHFIIPRPTSATCINVIHHGKTDIIVASNLTASMEDEIPILQHASSHVSKPHHLF